MANREAISTREVEERLLMPDTRSGDYSAAFLDAVEKPNEDKTPDPGTFLNSSGIFRRSRPLYRFQ